MKEIWGERDMRCKRYEVKKIQEVIEIWEQKIWGERDTWGDRDLSERDMRWKRYEVKEIWGERDTWGARYLRWKRDVHRER